MKVRLFFAWYDMWFGAYWDRKTRTLYICPLPMIVIALQFPAEDYETRRQRVLDTKL